MSNKDYKVPVMSEVFAQGKTPEFLFWVGCAGAYDDRCKKVTRSFAKILLHLGVDFAVLGNEERCTGDPARRAGNEMLFQMMALANIEILNAYNIKKIITICPHCYNIFKNEYPDMGGKYDVIHHTQFLKEMLEQKKLKVGNNKLKEQLVTYHDPCYMGRANDEYECARSLLDNMGLKNIEMKRHKSFALCCGAGGAQMFKEAEPGQKEVFIERTEEALATGTKTIVTSCPFCMTMMTDGLKYKNKEEEVLNYDIAELIAQSLGL